MAQVFLLEQNGEPRASIARDVVDGRECWVFEHLGEPAFVEIPPVVAGVLIHVFAPIVPKTSSTAVEGEL